MNISVSRELVNNNIIATVAVKGFTSQELGALKAFGAPLVEVGGNFTDTFTRTTETSPVFTIVGEGMGATPEVTIDPETGAITAINITGDYFGYTNASLSIAGNSVGSGADITLAVTDGVIVPTINDGGAGYVPNPLTIDFDLTAADKRLDTFFVARETFSFADSRNADLKAKAFTTEIESRLSLAMQALLAKKVEYIINTEKTL